MKKLARFLLLVLLFAPQISRVSFAEDSALIQKVIDGETVELSDGRRIHLIGIKTARVQGILKDRFKLSGARIASLPTETLSASAVKYVENHAMGKNVILSFDTENEKTQHKDSQGRVLAYIWYSTHVQAGEDSEGASKIFGVTSQDKLLNQELIMMGLALVDTSQSFLQKAAFLSSEKSAAESRLGFWRSAAELYRDLLNQASGAQFGSTAEFVSKESQQSSLEASRQAFTELIKKNPDDYRAFYERSWLGANAVHDKVTEENFLDAEQAAALSPLDPGCEMQKSFQLALLQRYDESSAAYEAMRLKAEKFGLRATVSEVAEEKLSRGEAGELTAFPNIKSIALEALRAAQNEDHFLFFMARYKSYGTAVPAEVQKLYDQVSVTGRFQDFLTKYEPDLITAKPRDLIYKTQWSLRGHDSPAEVMKGMERPGLAATSDQNVIDFTDRDPKKEAAKKKADAARQSEAQFS